MFCATDWVHFSFPKGALLKVPSGTWEEGPDTASKGKRTIKFRKNQQIPAHLIVDLIKQAVTANLEGKKPQFSVTKPGSKHYETPTEFVKILEDSGLYDEYESRPYYQQKGWIEWADSAKQPETRQKRIDRMISELRHSQYMPNKSDRQ